MAKTLNGRKLTRSLVEEVIKENTNPRVVKGLGLLNLTEVIVEVEDAFLPRIEKWKQYGVAIGLILVVAFGVIVSEKMK